MISLSTLFVNELRFDNRFFLLNEHTTTLEVCLLPKKLRILKERSAGCLKLICIAVVGLGAPLSRFLEGEPYIFLTE